MVESVHHSSGVYFPKRSHALRVSIKKLRYLLEFSATPDTEALQLLKKSQQILGEAQDRQVLFEIVEGLGKSGADGELDPLLAQVEAESTHLYDEFLQRRSELLAVCERLAAVEPSLRPRAIRGALVVLGAVAAGSAWHGIRVRAAAARR